MTKLSDNPDSPNPYDILRTLDRRIVGLRWGMIIAIIFGSGYLCAAVLLIGFNWNALGPAAPFGLGLVMADGVLVTVVAIFALGGHRVSSQVQYQLTEMVARIEEREAAYDKIANDRARQIAELTKAVAALTAKNAAQNAEFAEQTAGLARQVEGLRALLAAADQIHRSGNNVEPLEPRENRR